MTVDFLFCVTVSGEGEILTFASCKGKTDGYLTVFGYFQTIFAVFVGSGADGFCVVQKAYRHVFHWGIVLVGNGAENEVALSKQAIAVCQKQ